jgi:hypothetical protein
MPAKARTLVIDATPAFGLQGQDRLDALRKDVLPRLSAVIHNATSEASDTFGFDVMRGSDDVAEATDHAASAGLRPSEGDYPGLRGMTHPNFSLGLVATDEAVGIAFQVHSALEWRLFIKALYQHREMLGEYIEEFEELYILNSDGEEEAIEELDQLFAVDVESDTFKQNGASLYFPGLDYPVETEEDFETFTGDFAALFPFYWTLLKAARGETVDMDSLLNG